MSGGEEAAPRQARAPLRQRSRRRWAVAGGVAAGWLVLEVMTGSAVSATLVLVAVAALGGASLAGLRALGITRDHPWLQQMASRPWRDGQDVLRIAMRHLPDVFVVTPSGSLLAPAVVELQLNPADLDSLAERMELAVISSSLTEVYEEQVAAYQARRAAPGRAQVYGTASGSVPPGRYRPRQGDPVRAATRPDLAESSYAHAVPELAHAGRRRAYTGPVSPVWQDPGPLSPTVAAGGTTVLEQSVPPVPVLRLITGSSVVETRTSGARAGRGRGRHAAPGAAVRRPPLRPPPLGTVQPRHHVPDLPGTGPGRDPAERRGRGADRTARAAGCPGPLRGAADPARGGLVAGQR